MLDGQTNKIDKELYLLWEKGSFSQGLKAFLPLCAAILFRPAVFFKNTASLARADLKRHLWKAFIFAFIFGYVKLFLDYINIFWFQHLAKNLVEESQQLQISILASTLTESPFFFFRPFINFILVFLVLALSVKLVLGYDKKITPLFLIVCYKSAAEIFYLLPFIGGFIAMMWSVFILIAGLRELYRLDVVRLVFAGIIMPFLISIFVIMAGGPALNNLIVSLYPETKPQMTRLNETNTFVSMQDIVKAIAQYKQELGFYPEHLGVLGKFLASGLVQEALEGAGGYFFQYDKLDKAHFTLIAKPLDKNTTGRFVFYADETGKIYLGNSQGRQITSAKELQDLKT